MEDRKAGDDKEPPRRILGGVNKREKGETKWVSVTRVRGNRRISSGEESR